MIINSVNYKYDSQYKPANINFKQGLTREIVNHVKEMPQDEYKRITGRLWEKYGMTADVGCSNTVAFCVEQTADIMHRAGFLLPKCFKFEPISTCDLGQYDITDSVKINSAKREFLNLAELNKLIEQTYGHNDSKHFLDVYLHEFLHAAHLNHLAKNTYRAYGRDIFFDDLALYNPSNSLLNPIISFILHIFPTMTKKQVISLFPDGINLYGTSDLTEYFAEKNAKKLESELGENFDKNNIKQNMAQNYTGFPKDWNINNEAIKINKLPFLNRIMCGKLGSQERDKRIKKTLENVLNYFEGEIWNGNIDSIVSNSLALKNYGANYVNK